MIKYLLMTLGSFLLKFIPLKVAYKLASISVSPVMHFSKDYVNKAERNFEMITGRKDKNLVRKLFLNLALNTVDLLRFPYLKFKDIDGLLRINGMERLGEIYEKKRGIIFISLHLGNWEIGGFLLAHFGFSPYVVVEPIQPRKTLFRKDLIANLYRKYREKVGMHQIPLDKIGIGEYKLLRKGKTLVLLGDRDITGTGIEVEFFKKKVKLPRGPAILALRTNAAIVLGICVRVENYRFFVRIEPIDYSPSESVYEITSKIAQRMEFYIRKYPEQWFVFQTL